MTPAAGEKRVIVTGATGLIGCRLCAALQARGYHLVVFTRDPEKARRVVPGATGYVAWAAEGDWVAVVDGAWGVIHLAGAPAIGRRWSKASKREIYRSRVIGARGLVNAMRAARAKPAVFVSSSAAGYYGFRDDTPRAALAPPGDDFLAHVCVAWEHEARRAEELGDQPRLQRGARPGSTSSGLAARARCQVSCCA